MEPEGIRCQVDERFEFEARMIQGMARRLSAPADEGRGGGSRGEQAEEVTLTTALLHRGLTHADLLVREAAVFVTGRCRALDETADGRLTAALMLALETTTDKVLRMELAMAAGLRGEAPLGKAALRELAASGNPFDEPHKAAIYLARLGDPSGWPTIVRTLTAEVAHYRLMAMRGLLSFAEFDGQTVGGGVIDLRRHAVLRLQDAEELVRAEAPLVLETLGAPDLVSLLEDLADEDPSERVREAARQVLNRRAAP